MKLKRAYSPGEILNMRIPSYEFTRTVAGGHRQPRQKRHMDNMGCQREWQDLVRDAACQISLRLRQGYL